jgi:peptidoglycan/xylan/chitin deacetylase (PgdA/CDA1 family)
LDEVCALLQVDVPAYLHARQPYLTSEQIRTMLEEGFTFGAHSIHHPRLADLDESQIEAEIVESCRAVRTLTGQEQIPFAFPFSAHQVDRNFLARLLRRHPYIRPMFDTKGVHQAYQKNLTVFLGRFGIHP